MRTRHGVMTVVLIAVSVGLWAPTAEAGQPQHCAARLDPVGAGSKPGTVDAVLVDLGCFDTYAEALAAGSGGAIQVPEGTTPDSLTQLTLDAATAPLASDVLIGTEYDAVGYDGSSISYFAPSTCSATTNWQVSYVGATWNDRFESGKGFGNCDTNKKFQHSNFGGAVLVCTPNCNDYGFLADAVSSLKWRP